MEIHLECRRCGKVMSLGPVQQGAKVQCPYCNDEFILDMNELRESEGLGPTSVMSANTGAMLFLKSLAWINLIFGIIGGTILIIEGTRRTYDAWEITNGIAFGLGIACIWESLLILAFLLVVCEIAVDLRKSRIQIETRQESF